MKAIGVAQVLPRRLQGQWPVEERMQGGRFRGVRLLPRQAACWQINSGQRRRDSPRPWSCRPADDGFRRLRPCSKIPARARTQRQLRSGRTGRRSRRVVGLDRAASSVSASGAAAAPAPMQLNVAFHCAAHAAQRKPLLELFVSAVADSRALYQQSQWQPLYETRLPPAQAKTVSSMRCFAKDARIAGVGL